MRILVLDVPATESGALSILQQFHKEVQENGNQQDEWFFVISTPELSKSDNVKVIKYPWVKKSWFHRLYFDNFLIHKIVKKLNIDCVVSLQNTIIKYTKIPQIMYLHQPLPFVKKKYGLLENPKFWIYQNVISKTIIRSAKEAKYIIVQTEWLKDSLIELGIDSNKIYKNYPRVDFLDDYDSKEEFNCHEFIYPATPLTYKNHIAIVEACKRLQAKGVTNYSVYFTMNENDNKLSKQLKQEVDKYNLKIHFIGRQTKNALVGLYNRCTLLFPSYIETFGLPMLESRMCSGIVLASDSAFCKEVLHGYENAYFYGESDYSALSKLMDDVINERITRHNIEFDRAEDINLHKLVERLIANSFN